jgi:DNA-binding NarL/FixJ family response regulator
MIKILLVNETRLISNILSAAIEDEQDLKVVGSATNVEEALRRMQQTEVDVVLVSTRLPDRGALFLTQAISELAPETKIVVIGLTENKEQVLQYVEVGALGYVLKNDSVEDLITTIRAAQDGRALVSPDIAAALMQRVSELAHLFSNIETGIAATSSLTPREIQVLELIGQGLTNQEIAEKLVIEVGTVKNHVHNILDKLNVANREQAAAYLAILK